MKIVSFMTVFNDPEFLMETLESFKHYPDKLILIEGSWQSAIKSSGVKERSDQETYNIIDRYVDNKKIFLIQANEPLERDQRQIGMEWAKKEGADWIHMLDADEVYTKNSLLQIKNTLKITPQNILGYRLRSYNFLNSFKTWYEGNYMRIFRVTPEAKFYMDNDCSWETKGDIKIINGPYSGHSFFHYNYVKQKHEIFLRKMKYQNFQDPTFWSRYMDTGQYNSREDGLLQGFENYMKKIVYKIPDDISIHKNGFLGKHPKIMKNHLYFKNNIFNDSNIEFMEI